jgi:hypothetical protein
VVTPRNCQTGDAILTLAGLFTFNQGSTMSEYGIGTGSSPALPCGRGERFQTE